MATSAIFQSNQTDSRIIQQRRGLTCTSPQFPSPTPHIPFNVNLVPSSIHNIVSSMSKVSTIFYRKWLPGAAQILISTISPIVFFFLDFFDVVMCIFYRLVDEFLEGKASSCYCREREVKKGTSIDDDDEVYQESELSETLYKRKNMFKEMGFLKFHGFLENIPRKRRIGDASVSRNTRWSDCGCDTCVEWMSNLNDLKLHFVVKEPSHDTTKAEDRNESPAENAIFLHGFICSSSFWTETVFLNLSETIQQKYRLFAVDLLGFGKSPKPRDCLYTVKDHVEMIEKSVIRPFQLDSFHLVAHSMGCVIALALAAKYPESVKTITLIAPPYFPSKEDASLAALQRLAPRRIWPPLLFGSSFMSWYEHLGRCICFLICRNHKTWDRILKLLTRQRKLHFSIVDFTRHTHHSAWHSTHNVIYGGAKLVDRYLEVLNIAKLKIHVLHGSKDQVVPLECSANIKMKVANTRVSIVENADHNGIIVGREEEFIKELECIWSSTADLITELSNNC